MNFNPRASSSNPNVNTMVFSDHENIIHDLFEEKLIQWCEKMSGQEDYGRFTVDQSVLKSLNETDVKTITTRSL